MSTSTLPVSARRIGLVSTLCDYVELTKPRIGLLVLVVVVTSAVVGAGGAFQPMQILHACIGTLLIAASASAANQWLERRRDGQMNRTQGRPLPSGRLAPKSALAFAALTLVGGIGYSLVTLPLGTTLWAGLSWILYVLAYTPLKPLTSANTAVGAVAGALPVLIGWSASGAAVDIRAAALFLTLFLWQFPHFMAIAWLYREDYARGGYKMLPVIDPSGRRAGVQAVLSAAALIPVSSLLALAFPGWGGPLYLAAATLLGLAQLLIAGLFLAQMNRAAARRLLVMSLVYLPVLLAALLLIPWIS